MQPGTFQTLIVVKIVSFGAYLAQAQARESERILLPAKEMPQGLKLHDRIDVFIYRDSEDRLIATTAQPRITMNAPAALSVVQTSRIGAFLDWGLPKDLFLPYHEQLVHVKKGDEILVRMYVDKSSRLCASMRGLYHELSTESPYHAGDQVSGRVYEFSERFGTFIAVDDRFSARIPRHEDCSGLRIGDVIQARVTAVKNDGKLDLSLREKSYLQIDEDTRAVLTLLESYGGVLPFNDKASPEIILREAHMSKNAFKRAVGRLYKERKINFTEKGIRLL